MFEPPRPPGSSLDGRPQGPLPGTVCPLTPPVMGPVGLYTLTSPGGALVPQKMLQGKSRTEWNISHSKLARRHHVTLSDGAVQCVRMF